MLCSCPQQALAAHQHWPIKDTTPDSENGPLFLHNQNRFTSPSAPLGPGEGTGLAKVAVIPVPRPCCALKEGPEKKGEQQEEMPGIPGQRQPWAADLEWLPHPCGILRDRWGHGTGLRCVNKRLTRSAGHKGPFLVPA